MNRKALILVAGGALTIALVGTAIGAGAAETNAARDDSARSSTTTPTNPTTAGTPTDDVTGPANGPSVGATRPSDDRTAPTTGTDDRTTGTDDRTTGTDDRTASATGTIGRDRAVEIARSYLGGGQLVKVESELEHGRQMWSVRLVKDGAQVRVDVDSATGQITRSEQKSNG
jgi:hypothetical protein